MCKNTNSVTPVKLTTLGKAKILAKLKSMQGIGADDINRIIKGLGGESLNDLDEANLQEFITSLELL